MLSPLLDALARTHPRARDFIALTRLDRPIGIYLLLWPTLSALWIAAEGLPPLALIVIFTLGVILTRSAGCAINDYADRDFDGHVQRTRDRPLASGLLRPREALLTFAVLMVAAFALVLLTNPFTVLLSFGAVAMAALYPFMKRHTHLPQLFLGAAYSWGILMAFSATRGEVPAAAWLLYAANLLWTIAYDTYYAMTDRDDDLKIGVKSTAILFGRADRQIILALQGLQLACLALAGHAFGLGLLFEIGLGTAAGCYAWQYQSTRSRERLVCLQAFLHNHWAGLAVFAGVLLDQLAR
ncbi:4-hydroxybenzoate octaprenyltransferase [Pseudomonas sp. NW5]|uniref:4-hydroxybenzoate octaprenyltransferase n=1 Tax=Pseudomonas sp. NW5 TaxID=2934934 RepID=UPI0020222F48|nr:4-hydroxybenzoate octaprenyltransferase [Pseudomonas sp. NW5]MCL7463021.1 4-hydroxybenzoate octaprenyltransferase [Pseudomonas sp. NW5]